MTHEEDDQEKQPESLAVASRERELANGVSSENGDAGTGLLGVERFLRSDARRIRVVSLESLKVKS